MIDVADGKDGALAAGIAVACHDALICLYVGTNRADIVLNSSLQENKDLTM